MERDELRQYYNLCDPVEPLTTDDERYVQLDAYGTRGEELVVELAAEIELAGRPTARLVTGQRGVGLTTELNRLSSRLRQRFGILVARIDARDALDLTRPLDTLSVMIAVRASIERAVSADLATASAFRSGFWDVLRIGGDLAEGNGETRTPAWVEHVLHENLLNPTFRKRVRARVEERFSTAVEEFRGDLELLRAHVREAGWSDLFVIVDSLTHLQGVSDNAAEVERSAEEFFAREVASLDLPVHTLWTVPAFLLSRAPLTGLRVLPNVMIRTPEGVLVEEGLNALRDIVQRRVPLGMLPGLANTTHRDLAFDRLTAAWSGNLREVIRLLRTLILRAGSPRALERTVAEMTEERHLLVGREERHLLRRVHEEHRLPDEDPRRVGELLTAGLVLAYRGDREWYDIHPAMPDLLAEPSRV